MLLKKCHKREKYKPYKLCKPTAAKLKEEEERHILMWLNEQKYLYIHKRKSDEKGELDKRTKKLRSKVNELKKLVHNTSRNQKREDQGGRQQLQVTKDRLSTMISVLDSTLAIQEASELDQEKQSLVSKERRETFNVHFECRNQQYPETEINRTTVPDNKVDWAIEWSEYKAHRYSDDKVANLYKIFDKLDDGTGPDLPFNQYDKKEQINRMSSGASYQVKDGYPFNPVGRTGVSGRGALPFLGPNHSICCAFTRPKTHVAGMPRKRKPVEIDDMPVYEILVFFDKPSKRWTLPIVSCLGTFTFGRSVVRFTFRGRVSFILEAYVHRRRAYLDRRNRHRRTGFRIYWNPQFKLRITILKRRQR